MMKYGPKLDVVVSLKTITLRYAQGMNYVFIIY